METDLQLVTTAPPRTQVCIVGGGIAGIVLAHSLAACGISVALLEAGGHTFQGETRIAEQTPTSLHHGTAEGQSRVLGGTSLRWGGQLLPLLDPTAWPIDPATLTPYITQAETLLGVDHLPFAANQFFLSAGQPSPALLSGLSDIDGWLSKWTPFARRNLAATLGRGLLRSPHVRVYLHAQVTELLPTPDGTRIEAAIARSPNGNTLRFQAAQFVLAGGTVETVRLLLASRSQSPAGIGNAHGQLGRNFHDHLTLPVATLTGEARARILNELAPWIVRSPYLRFQRIRSRAHSPTLHSAKLVASPALCARLGIQPVLAHLTLEEPEGEGVAAIRALLRARQGKGLPLAVLRNAGRLPGAAIEALRLASAMLLQGRRYVSPRARVQLYLNAAQCTTYHHNAGAPHLASEMWESKNVGAPHLDSEMWETKNAGAPHLASEMWESKNVGAPHLASEMWESKNVGAPHLASEMWESKNVGAPHLASEMWETSTSRITLSSTLDPAGMPLAHLDWRIAPCELRTLRRFALWLRDYLAAQGLHGIDWDPATFAPDDAPLPLLDDARHAMGGACMGTDPLSSVTDPDLRIHGLDNLSLASAATFPTGAAHLPTLPLIALTLRLADRLASTPNPQPPTPNPQPLTPNP
jgi:choline dehydrogenase-like flavoprotein